MQNLESLGTLFIFGLYDAGTMERPAKHSLDTYLDKSFLGLGSTDTVRRQFIQIESPARFCVALSVQ